SGNTNSSPFPRYASAFDPGGDVIYVGDDSGKLWKITSAFNGTPTLAGAPWPITVNTGRRLTGPVFDFTSKNIFVADDSGRLSFVKEEGSSTGFCASGLPPCLGL